MSKDFKGVLEVRTEVTYFVVVIMNNKKYSVSIISHTFSLERKTFTKKKLMCSDLPTEKLLKVLQFVDHASNSY